MPEPKLNGFDSNAVWSHYVFPDQVEVNCTPRKPGQSVEKYVLPRYAAQIRSAGMSLISVEPVRMKVQISDMEAYEQKLKVQKETMKLYGDGSDTSRPLWTKQILRNGLIAPDCQDLGVKLPLSSVANRPLRMIGARIAAL